MKYLCVSTLLVLASLLGACGTTGVAPTAETVLLVSLDSGVVIKQTIRANADVCFKNSSDSATTCLTQGEPVMDPATNTVIGFKMIEHHIELIAKSD
jgi:hypothetical protein